MSSDNLITFFFSLGVDQLWYHYALRSRDSWTRLPGVIYRLHPLVERRLIDTPRILTVGPTFKMNALAVAGVDIEMDMVLNLNYEVDNLQLFFPPLSGLKSTGSLLPANSRECPLYVFLTDC